MSEDSTDEVAIAQEEAEQESADLASRDQQQSTPDQQPEQTEQPELQVETQAQPSTESQPPTELQQQAQPQQQTPAKPQLQLPNQPVPQSQPQPRPQPPTSPKEEPNNAELRSYLQDGMLADGRICAVFFPGMANNSPIWQFELVFNDLAKEVSNMSLKYIDFEQSKFNPEGICRKALEEINRREYSRYLVVGSGLGGQLAYNVLMKLDEDMAGRTTGILFSTPADKTNIRHASVMAEWFFKRDKLAKFFDRFRKIYWKLFEVRQDISKYTVDVGDAYLRKQAHERNFPVDTFFAQGSYFYEFRATQPVTSRLIVVDEVNDKAVKNAGTWDKLATEIEHRKMIGGYTDSIIGHPEFSRIIIDEVNREGQVLKSIMEAFETVKF